MPLLSGSRLRGHFAPETVFEETSTTLPGTERLTRQLSPGRAARPNDGLQGPGDALFREYPPGHFADARDPVKLTPAEGRRIQRLLKHVKLPSGRCRAGVISVSHNLRLRDGEESLQERIKC